MSTLADGVRAVYYFLVGDMRILAGTLAAVVLTGLLASTAPALAGLQLFALVAITLAFALRHEIHP